MKDKYIILELIPTKIKDGDIIQLSALKIDNLKILDRFDYRLKEDKIIYPDMLKIIDYDKESFTYLESTKDILDDFKNWSDNLPIYILDNKYTYNYLEKLENEKIFIEKYLNIEYSDDIIDVIMKKYNLQPTEYIVDLLYEALMYEN